MFSNIIRVVRADKGLLQFTIDLSALAKTGGYPTPGDGYIFNINVCDNVTCGDGNAGVCQVSEEWAVWNVEYRIDRCPL
jgi:hypothetical protein